jgi:hypothetical protein
MSRALATGLVIGISALLASGCAVTPVVPFKHSTFEGIDVISYVPDHPRGIVYVFHGTGGSANFAQKIETTDVLNRLILRGYGFVSTSSTERTGDRRWNAADPSLTTNPDLARLARLQAHLVATTPIEANTPLVGIGMSNGARFVTLWGQSWKDAGYPVKAIWASHGRTAQPYSGNGQLKVPVVFTTSANDFTSAPGGVAASFVAAHNYGTPSEFYTSQERKLNAAQYERIPGIDPDKSKQIYFSLVASGVWNGQGQRVASDVVDAATRAVSAQLPASVAAQDNAIDDESLLILAVHQFTAEYAEQVIAFFDRYVP